MLDKEIQTTIDQFLNQLESVATMDPSDYTSYYNNIVTETLGQFGLQSE